MHDELLINRVDELLIKHDVIISRIIFNSFITPSLLFNALYFV